MPALTLLHCSVSMFLGILAVLVAFQLLNNCVTSEKVLYKSHAPHKAHCFLGNETKFPGVFHPAKLAVDPERVFSG